VTGKIKELVVASSARKASSMVISPVRNRTGVPW
jgi:hypothetical protein